MAHGNIIQPGSWDTTFTLLHQGRFRDPSLQTHGATPVPPRPIARPPSGLSIKRVFKAPLCAGPDRGPDRPTRAGNPPVLAALLAAGFLAATSFAAPAAAADAQALVEGLKTVAGNPPAVRATFAKGQCVRGAYTPATDVGLVTRSVSFTQPWPILGRFSVGGGKPAVEDTTRTALRGFSVKILSQGGGTDLLFENAPVHFARTLDQMQAFLRVRAPGPDGKPDQDAIASFAKENPETTRQAAFIAAKPLPASYAGIVYWGVHTFWGTNLGGQEVPFKFKIVPEAGELGLTDEQAKTRPPHFLVADLAERLAKGPVKFDVVALLAKPTDDVSDDITRRWEDEESRKAVTLGTIAITAIEPNATCDEGIFDPGQLSDGIGAPRDEIFTARLTAYAISLGLRLQ